MMAEVMRRASSVNILMNAMKNSYLTPKATFSHGKQQKYESK